METFKAWLDQRFKSDLHLSKLFQMLRLFEVSLSLVMCIPKYLTVDLTGILWIVVSGHLDTVHIVSSLHVSRLFTVTTKLHHNIIDIKQASNAIA